MVVTDNGANFVKAFKVFAPSSQEESSESESDDPNLINEDIVSQSLNLNADSEELSLPPHFRCAAHTLNLVAAHDLASAALTAQCKALLRSSLTKATGLWNRYQRSVQNAEVVQKYAERSLVVPIQTRWNSLYNSLCCLKDIPALQLELILDELELPRFTIIERKFIGEYCQILKPLAEALDLLQGEKDATLGKF